jgi:protoheme IX farnesyltransferase
MSVKMETEPAIQVQPVAMSKARTIVRDYVALTKPRIMLLLLFTEYCAMIVANHGLPSLGSTIIGLVGLALSTGGAAALNMWYDSDIDILMKRTRLRPIPAGRVKKAEALWFGLILQTLSFLWLGFTANWLSATLCLGGFIYYVVIYTMWLKRNTTQNIVIGGGAGAFPPLVGWAVVTNHLSWAPVIMFLIIFFWTPPHFWSLALYKQDDYRTAKIPMMPVIRGPKITKWQSLWYSFLLTGTSLILYWTHSVGRVYLVGALVLGLVMTAHILLSLIERQTLLWARRSFKFSLLYLPTLFVMMVLNIQH